MNLAGLVRIFMPFSGLSGGGTPIPPPGPLATGCVIYYRLDEPHGTPRAESVSGTLPLAEAGTVNRRTGIIGNAAVFDATAGQQLSVTDASVALGNFDWEFSCWVQLDSTADQQYIVTIDNYTYLSYEPGFPNYKFTLAGIGSSVVAGSPAPSVGEWHLVNWYYRNSDTTMGISVDGGVSVEAVTGSPPGTGPTTLRLGSLFGAAIVGLKGAADGFGLWFRNLTPTERTQLYAAGVGLDYPFVVAPAAYSSRGALLGVGS